MKRNRIPISSEVAAEVQFLSDRTCCVCNIPGKPIQIHHIDENPSNNGLSNLTILCLDCHNDTMIKGGFGRKLDAYQVIIYRDQWHDRVQKRRDDADRIASLKAVTGLDNNSAGEDINSLNYKLNDDPTLLMRYLERILTIRDAQNTIAQTYWDTGITLEMINGSRLLIDFLEEVLLELSTFYPKGHFNNLHPKLYFNNLIAERYLWHRFMLEPHGVGTGGSIVPVQLSGEIVNELQSLVLSMVNSLAFQYTLEGNLNLDEWMNRWNGDGKSILDKPE